VLLTGRAVVRVHQHIRVDKTYRSYSSSRDLGGVHRRSKPSRSLESARRRALSKAFRSRIIASSRSVSRALTDRPSSAATIRASRSRSASSFRVTFVFISSRFLRLHGLACSTGLRAIPRLGQSSQEYESGRIAGACAVSMCARCRFASGKLQADCFRLTPEAVPRALVVPLRSRFEIAGTWR
jgi:hypothetical protein